MARQYKTYSDDALMEAVAKSTSIRGVLRELNLAPQGGNYQTVQRHIDRLKLSTAHMTGQGHSKGKSLPPKTPTEEYLSNERPIGSFRLKNRLLREGYFEHRCSSCGLIEWLGDPIPLELDHINGDSQDNRLNNIRLLCPNCHSLTPTYRGKNKRLKAK